MKRSIIIPLLLVIYLCVMAYIGWPYYSENGDYIEYFGLIILTLVIIIILYFFLKRRDSYRREVRKRKDASMRRSLRDEKIR